jgi:hypothetical protein
LGGALRTGALAPGYAAELSLGVLVSSTGVSHQSPRAPTALTAEVLEMISLSICLVVQPIEIPGGVVSK